jgi:hypothetical protein
MVTTTTIANTAVAACLAMQSQPPVWARMNPEDRARVFAALGGLVVLGIALILLAWWGARATRRYINQPTKPVRPPIPVDDWATRRLYPGDAESGVSDPGISDPGDSDPGDPEEPPDA